MLEHCISLALVPLCELQVEYWYDGSKLRILRTSDVGHASLAPMLSLDTGFAQGTVVQDRPARLTKFADVQLVKNIRNRFIIY